MAVRSLPSFLMLVVLSGATCQNRGFPRDQTSITGQQQAAFSYKQDKTASRGSFNSSTPNRFQSGEVSWSVHHANELLTESQYHDSKQQSGISSVDQYDQPAQRPSGPTQQKGSPYLSSSNSQTQAFGSGPSSSVQSQQRPVAYEGDQSEQSRLPSSQNRNENIPNRNGNVPSSLQYSTSHDRIPGGLNAQNIPQSQGTQRPGFSSSPNLASSQGIQESSTFSGTLSPQSQPTRIVPKPNDGYSSVQPNSGSVQGETASSSYDYNNRETSPHTGSSPGASLESFPTDTSEYIQFAWDLFRNTDNNYGVIVSPPILAYQLMLFKKYSAGQTKGELERVFRNAKPEQIKSLIDETRTSPTTKLELANGIFYDRTVTINPLFKDDDKNFTHMMQLYFSHEREQVIGVINRWADAATNHEIKELLDRNFPIQRVKMLLATAMYFKAAWKHRFNSTEAGPFVNYRNEQKLVPFMEIRNNILIDRKAYTVAQRNVNVQVIQLPYDDGVHAMLLLIPMDKNIRIGDVREHFTGNAFIEIIESISQNSPQRVTLKMPKFSKNSEIDPVRSLQAMGIKSLFTDRAELNIATTPVSVGDIIQRSILRVDEVGTTAASVAASFLIPLSADSVVNREIILDRPFLSIIYNVQNNSPLFISHVADV